MAEFKKISDVDVINTLTDNDNVVVIGSDGALKQTSSANIKGSSSWGDLEDKPFGEDTDGTIKKLDEKYLPYGEYTLEPIAFDGNVDGKETVSPTDGVMLVKVSDTPFSRESVIGGEVTMTPFDGTENEIVPIDESMVVDFGSILVVGEGFIFCAYADGTDFNGLIFNRGVYFMYQPNGYCSKLVLPEQIKKIPSAWIPSCATTFYVSSNDGGLYTTGLLDEGKQADSSDVKAAIARGAIFIRDITNSELKLTSAVSITSGMSGYYVKAMWDCDESNGYNTSDYNAGAN